MKDKLQQFTEQTVEQRYEAKRQSIIALAAQLGSLVQTHKSGPVDWGHVGDLAEIESKLRDAVEFLGGS